MPKIPTTVEMLEAGVHFGHQQSKWHPKMKPFIFGVKNDIHIINVEKTAEKLKEVSDFILQIISKGGTILFLGTKNQVKDVLKREAIRCGCPYVNERWLGGLLTNFNVVSRLIKKYKDLVKRRDSGDLEKYTKKEQLEFNKEIKRLYSAIGGLLDLEKLPDAIFVWDIKKEKTAVKEAQKKKIPIIAICDTNSNITGIDYPIPANDDATKTIELLMPFIADCVLEARKFSEAKKEEKNKS